MCGRYYVDDDTAREIEKLVRQVEEKVNGAKRSTDVFPSQTAPVISGCEEGLNASMKAWGYPGIQGKGLIINARAETVLEKRMFQEGIQHGRCIIPAAGFYEWNQAKEKLRFERPHVRNPEKEILLMAGIFQKKEGEDRFVILTTAANDSMKEIHDRMPLILEPDEIESWIFREDRTRELLQKKPGELCKSAEYEQIRMPFL